MLLLRRTRQGTRLFFQTVLKGIGGIGDDEADAILTRDGIMCNWWRTVGEISPSEWQAKLTERNVLWHLNHYNDVDPSTGSPFSKNTPFISTTAGTVEREPTDNVKFPGFATAIRFATGDFTRDGYVFYGYVYTLGKKALVLVDFSEEVRDLLIYTSFLPFHPEGEILTKIHIPAVRLEKFEKYAADGRLICTKANANYAAPERYTNIRGAL
jgi:hypothetical protein